MRNRIHFILQGKGGVGKSFVSWTLAQYLQSLPNVNLLCADTDPTNPTFSSYPAFKAHHINIMTPDMNIDRKIFDNLLEMLCDHEGDSIVDNGASSFLPMMAYIKEIDEITILMEQGKEVYIHVPLVGGLGMDETLKGLKVVLDHTPASVIVWENELFGPVVKDGKSFTQSKFIENYSDRIKGVIRIEKRSQDTFGVTMHALTSKKMTVKEARDSKQFMIGELQRLVMFQKSIFEQLSRLDVFNEVPALTV
jgi:hypothetical protein